jgi:hypothetical protein
MPEIPLGLSFDESDGGFTIRNKRADGFVTEIKMSAEHVHAKTEIDLWTDRKMRSSQL